MLALLNDQAFITNIGDRNVRSFDDARAYIANGAVASYAQHGFGLYAMELRDEAGPIGIAGLVKREGLQDVDVGFALLPEFRGRGYAAEAVAGVLAHARDDLAIRRLVAVVLPGNTGSIRILEAAGFRQEGMVRLPAGDEDLVLYAIAW